MIAHQMNDTAGRVEWRMDCQSDRVVDRVRRKLFLGTGDLGIDFDGGVLTGTATQSTLANDLPLGFRTLFDSINEIES